MRTITIERELDERIRLNYDRLYAPYYQIDEVFSPITYKSHGDKEGRALLAFLCQLRLTGRENPCLRPMLAALPQKLNAQGYFGPIRDGIIDEFQFGGHVWFLRALCDAAVLLRDKSLMDRARQLFEGLYLPALHKFDTYPTDHEELVGDFGGKALTVGNWILCSDIGASFLAMDGLADYYAASGDERALKLFNELADVFASLDLLAIRAQTHAALSAARGLLKMYGHTGEKRFADTARKVWELYLAKGMTASYHNLNWFDRPKWTEPCAIVDSMIMALDMYRLYGDENDLVMARRIWHNGMSSGQRPNGGAGPDTCVVPGQSVLKETGYECYFCCTMRYSEGMLYAKKYADLLAITVPDMPERDEMGRYMAGDLLYGEILTDCPKQEHTVRVDGHDLSSLVKVYTLPDETARALEQRILF